MRLLLSLIPLALAAQQIAFRDVAVVDVEAGVARPDMTVIVSGRRIVAVRPSREIPIPAGARVVDGRGKFLMPGLWDMHVHMHAGPDVAADAANRTFFAPQFVSHGITGVRSMWDSMASVRALRADIDAGRIPGPRMVATGAMLDGPQPFWPGSISCATAEEGRAAVQRLKQEGAEFVKVYSGLPREAYFAIGSEAGRLGLPFAGHVPNGVSAAEASDAGQKSVEHLLGVFESCSPAGKTGPPTGMEKFGRGMRQAAAAYDPQRAASLFARFVKNGTWFVPTLAVLRTVAFLGDPELTKDERVNLLPGILPQFWKSPGPSMDPSSGSLAERKAHFDRELRLVGNMHRAGVKILAGTDTPNPWVFPGTSLQEELELLVQAGLTPAESLRASTLRPAEFVDAASRLGTVSAGKMADLVLLSADPLAGIANTRRIEAVMVDGRLYGARDLQKMTAPARER